MCSSVQKQSTASIRQKLVELGLGFRIKGLRLSKQKEKPQENKTPSDNNTLNVKKRKERKTQCKQAIFMQILPETGLEIFYSKMFQLEQI